MKKLILNQDNNILETKNSNGVDLELKKTINALKGSFFDLETGNVNYKAMKGSEEFEAYKAITSSLKYFELSSLLSREAKLAFWINIYNVLVVHGIVELEVKNSVNEISSFFEKVSYQIDNYIFSLDDIEHGLLRGNVKKHFFAKRPFASTDPRLQFGLTTLEPRIHFALVCGSKSCPPIGTYQEEKIDQQLDLAASSFINSEDIVINQDKKQLTISKIFKWYGKDFGNKNQLINFFAKYRKNEAEKDFLLQNKFNISIRYLNYNWNLNN